MGAIPEADPDEVLETKPFKFVTGKSTPLSRKNRGLEPAVRVNG
jgi:cytochrome c oxidase subunit 6b